MEQRCLWNRRSRLAEQPHQRCLPITEGPSKLPLHKEVVHCPSQHTKTHVVFDDVANGSSGHAVAGLGCQLMAMMKELERSCLLDVGKVIIPFEFGDQGDPLGAERQEWKHAK